jgi:hypothetical protein
VLRASVFSSGVTVELARRRLRHVVVVQSGLQNRIAFKAKGWQA